MRSAVQTVCSVFVTVALFAAGRAYAQTPQTPQTPPIQQVPPLPQSAPPGGPVAPVVTIIGEEYHVEFSAGAWVTRPSTVEYSDTETLTNTVGSTTTTTVVNGTLINFRSQLALPNLTFPEGHLTVRIAPKQKIRGEYIPLQYKETVGSLSSDINFNGQTYKAGQTVESTYHWNEWKVAYEYDALVFDRGFVGGQAALSAMNISAAMANTVQSGTASVTILMPGLGAIGRYYLTSRISVTADFFGFWLPGSGTSTHAHSLEIDGYGMFNFNKHVAAQVGVRAWDAAHVWNNPLNTGSITVVGPYVGGTARF